MAKETCLHGKRDVLTWNNRRVNTAKAKATYYMAKETYYMAKETYYTAKAKATYECNGLYYTIAFVLYYSICTIL